MKRPQKIDGFSWRDVMNCRNELFGISILWIIAFHIYCQTGIVGIKAEGFGKWVSILLSMFLYRGNIGVDIFLFLSAIGLSKSIQNNSTATFYKHRFHRVGVPYLLIAIPYFIWLDLFLRKDGVLQLLLNITTLNYWLTGNHPTWYIAFIIVMYLLFPLLYRWDKKTNHVSTVVIIIVSVVSEYIMSKTGFFLFKTSERALSRVPVFLIGLLCAPCVFSGKRIPVWQVLMFVFVGMWFFALISLSPSCNIVLQRYSYIPISVAIIVGYAFLRHLVNLNGLWRVLAWIGTISLELYIAHVFMLRAVFAAKIWPKVSPELWWVIIPFASLLVALLLQQITKRIIRQKT
jgi:peptidoglycan/LPS O-acetylase OafA/YrhL